MRTDCLDIDASWHACGFQHRLWSCLVTQRAALCCFVDEIALWRCRFLESVNIEVIFNTARAQHTDLFLPAVLHTFIGIVQVCLHLQHDHTGVHCCPMMCTPHAHPHVLTRLTSSVTWTCPSCKQAGTDMQHATGSTALMWYWATGPSFACISLNMSLVLRALSTCTLLAGLTWT